MEDVVSRGERCPGAEEESHYCWEVCRAEGVLGTAVGTARREGVRAADSGVERGVTAVCGVIDVCSVL